MGKPAERMKRLPMSVPDDWKAAMRAQAESEGLTLTRWLLLCAEANLRPHVRKSLSPLPEMGRPKA